MEYKQTLNLPKTDFPMKAELAKREPEILKFWEKLGLYDRIREKNRGKQKYILHDGPPYANGHVHIGTALNKILKDIVIKYKSMQGYDAPYVPGWDCHGLPVELQVLKELGVSKSELNLLDFRKKAKEYAMRFLNIQRDEFKRLGGIGNWDHPYITMDPSYEAKVIEVFGELALKGYIYKGLKPVYWCATCETALAEAEVEYKEKQSPSIFVRFPVPGSKKIFGIDGPVSFLIWTTTPWTLVANEAVALHPDYTYDLVRMNGEIIIAAKELWNRTLSQRLGGSNKFEVAASKTGRELNGIECSHPFFEGKVSKIILENYVTLEDGTGCVHTAPGHGEEDYTAGKKNGLPIFSPLDDRGRYTKEAPDLMVGKPVTDPATNQDVISYLKQKGLLFGIVYPENKDCDIITHSYPHCWRCSNPIIFRATEQWFLDIDKDGLRQKVLEGIKGARWVPDIGRNRISSMMEMRPDWCMSRQRFWGVPLPVFYCLGCNKPLITAESISAVKEIVKKEGSDAWFKYEAKEILPAGAKCAACGKTEFRKEKDILDVWFDSGVSYEAVVRSDPDLQFPADLYLEGSDQHRGWFQHSLIPSMAVLNEVPFKSVLTHGFVVDGDGRKMSKSLGNVISPEEIIQKYGADILRLWVATQDYTGDVRMSGELLEQLSDEYRKIRNTFRFLLGNLCDFKPGDSVSFKDMPEVDRFMLGHLQGLIKEVTQAYENFEYYRVFRSVYSYCVVDLSAFYLDVLKDRLYTFRAGSKERRAAQTVLAGILSSLARMIAPVLSFTAQEVWGYTGAGSESPFLSSWPEPDESVVDKELGIKWGKVLALRREVNRSLELLRAGNKIGNSLEARVNIHSCSGDIHGFLGSVADMNSVFLVSAAAFSMHSGEEYGKLEVQESQVEGLGKVKIAVSRAEGKKCARCWNYSKTTGSDSSHPELCAKCAAQL